MGRSKIVAGNWKMNLDLEAGKELVSAILNGVGSDGSEVIVIPPFTHLQTIGEMVQGTPVSMGAQNCHQESAGAYTGEVSVDMLLSVGTEFVLVGHSERREYAMENDALLAAKTDAALAGGLRPIFCCGEPLGVREAEEHFSFVNSQIEAGLFHLGADQMAKVTLAYEPIWAIGTGKTASAEQAQDMHAIIRKQVAEKYGEQIAEEIRILYGGSCNPGNAAELFSNPDVDGGLIGGASLKPDDFLSIIEQSHTHA